MRSIFLVPLATRQVLHSHMWLAATGWALQMEGFAAAENSTGQC